SLLRNHCGNDVTVWSPLGGIYGAKFALQQGSARSQNKTRAALIRMRGGECLDSTFFFTRPLPVSLLVSLIRNKSQISPSTTVWPETI
ncbi:hypothetical protein A6R68_11394, partial [Neotoma lepida]